MDDKVKTVLMAGVGGQGILRASDILSVVLMEAGLDVKKSEVHGMAQRGGCVTSHVRYGEKVYSPIARKGDVDILVSFEKMEILRYFDYLKSGSIVIVNDEEIYPPAVNLGEMLYPQDVMTIVQKTFKSVRIIDAGATAIRAGNKRTANTVLLGALSNYLPIQKNLWEKVLRGSFPLKVVEENIKAFSLGQSA